VRVRGPDLGRLLLGLLELAATVTTGAEEHVAATGDQHEGEDDDPPLTAFAAAIAASAQLSLPSSFSMSPEASLSFCCTSAVPASKPYLRSPVATANTAWLPERPEACRVSVAQLCPLAPSKLST